LQAEDSLSRVHHLQTTVVGSVFWPGNRPNSEDVTQTLFFNISSIDQEPTQSLAFVLVFRPESLRRLQVLTAMSQTRLVDFAGSDRSFAPGDADRIQPEDDVMINMHASTKDFDLAAEVETLSLLEYEAKGLQTQILAKKKAIAAHLREHRGSVSLKQLLEECDGLICAARVMAQRICDRVGIVAESSRGFANMQNTHFQDLLNYSDESENPQQTLRNCTHSRIFRRCHASQSNQTGGAQAARLQLFMTKNSTRSEYHLIDVVDSPNPLLRTLEFIATVIGLLALVRFIRRKCMSMRKRVERAADREERRNARAYRRAARRAEMRNRWDDFVSAVSCFPAAPEPRNEDYEEKRALIVQDAFLEQLEDLENAEKGEIMEAEIHELRHAQEIVSSLVRGRERRDPPPPLVPLSEDTSSRASTHTLPSYTSESLPDYSSRAETLADSNSGSGNSVVDGFTDYTPSPPAHASRGTPPSVSSEGRTRSTPTSSIVDVSPRISEETLRTQQSKGTPG